MLRLALPSNPDWQELTLAFLGDCGINVRRVNARRYTGTIPAIPTASVLFQRAADIPRQIEQGAVELGLAGLDQFCEAHSTGGDGIALLDDLGFRHADLVIAVPESWEHITSCADLVALTADSEKPDKQLRIATKYPKLTERFLISNKVTEFTIVESGGTLEAAPAMGYADIIVDITSTGNTLRENQLKPISGGTVIKSQACLIGNLRLLAQDAEALDGVKTILEMIEARLRASEYYSIIANIKGESSSNVASQVQLLPEIAGIEGPTVSQVFSSEGGTAWYAVTMVVQRAKVMKAVDHLRSIGGTGVTVSPTTYVFEAECRAYQRLLRALNQYS